MVETMKRALEYAINKSYAITKSEDPPKIKEYVEEYFSTIGGDRRYKLKWKAIACKYKYVFTGMFEYHGRTYYFNKVNDELKLEYHKWR